MIDPETVRRVMRDDPIRARDHNGLLRAIRRSRVVAVIGGVLRQTEDGQTITITTPVLPHSFKVVVQSATTVTVQPGTVGTDVPTINGSSLTAATPPPLTVAAGNFVSAKVTFASAESCEVSSVVIEAGGAPSNTDTVLYQPLALIETSGSGIKARQLCAHSLSVVCCVPKDDEGNPETAVRALAAV